VQSDGTDRYRSSTDSSGILDDEQPSPNEQSLISSNGALRKGVIRDMSMPIVQRWERDGAVERIRSRLLVFLAASIAVIIFQQAVSLRGFSETVVNVWALAAIPTAAVSACIHKTLEDPDRADEIWFSQKTLATVGMVALAVLVRGGRENAIGRVAWQVLFGEDSPEGAVGAFGTDDSTVDESSVRELKQILFLGAVGSIAILVFEQVIVGNQWDSLGDGGQSTGTNPFGGVGGLDVFGGFGTVEWLFISAAMVLVGTVLGALLAVVRP